MLSNALSNFSSLESVNYHELRSHNTISKSVNSKKINSVADEQSSNVIEKNILKNKLVTLGVYINKYKSLDDAFILMATIIGIFILRVF